MTNHHLVACLAALLLVLGSPAASPSSLSAQEPTTGGFLFSYQPRAGERPLFEAGYRRHLDWHESMRDSLSWFGWDVLVGPRPGLFVDGVFGVPFAALDARVDPAGDQADAARNVLTHADPLSREMLALRPDLSTADPLADGAPSLFVEVVRYPVSPAGSRVMELALASLGERGRDGVLLPYTVYERVAGASPGFVLMIWRDRLATFDEHGRNPRRALRAILSDVRGVLSGARDALPGTTAGAAGERDTAASRPPTSLLDGPVTSEVWMYRRDLTYLGADGGR